jgi:predicted component of type VI protein secretion system
MDVKLVVLGGKHPGQEIAVTVPEFLIGRASECKLRPNSDMVSRRHSMIAVSEGRATIRDLGSRNGTIVNDKKITGEHELRTGDKIKVGPLLFEVQLSTSVSGKKKPKVHSVQEAAARTVESVKPRDHEEDIGDWLNEDETVNDTKNNSLTTTFMPASIPKPVEAATVPRGDDGGTQRIDPLAGPGQAKKPTAESSRSAAADVLKQFFNTKR